MSILVLNSIEQAVFTLLLIILIILFIYYIVTFIIAIIYYQRAIKRPKKNQFGKTSSKWSPYKDLINQNIELFNLLPKEEIEITGINNKKIKGYFLPSKNQSQKVVIFSHGWKNIGATDYACNGYFFHDFDYNVLVVEHLGHGKSEGKYINFGYFDSKNIELWVQYINQKFNNQCEIFLDGVSMGATAVLMLASTPMQNVKAIVADSGYTNGYEQCKNVVAKHSKTSVGLISFNIRMITKVFARYDLKQCSTINALNHSIYPILFLHGEKDRFVPIKNLVTNYESCTSLKEVMVFDDSSHIEAGLKYPEKYQNTIIAFLEKYK